MDTIDIPAKQSPVINRLHDTLVLARAYADASRLRRHPLFPF
jgi:hypothetical protein